MTEADDTPGAGHNGVAVDELRAFIQRVERIEAEMDDLREDRAALFAEIKGHGFDTKAVRKIVRERKRQPHKREEENAILRLYADALDIDIFA